MHGRILIHPSSSRIAARGFSLVELMVAMVLGLIVIAAVLSFILSLIRANSETVLDTRLNQELRSTMAVIAGEVQRARGIRDPIAAVGQTSGIDYNNDGVVDAVDADFPDILIEDGSKCVRYAYYDGSAFVYRAIYLADGRIGMDAGPTRADATCGGGSPISTADGVRINELQFAHDPSVNGSRWFSIHLQGQLAAPPGYMTNATFMAIKAKTIRQVVAIRSNET